MARTGRRPASRRRGASGADQDRLHARGAEAVPKGRCIMIATTVSLFSLTATGGTVSCLDVLAALTRPPSGGAGG
jgi:hypothetical protein